MTQLAAQLAKQGPPPAGALPAAGRALNFSWPPDYAAFIGETGECEGFVGASYVALWSPDELLERNEGYGFREYARNLVAFGSDGGGEAFAFDRSESTIVMVPFVGMDQPVVLGRSFREFLRRLETGSLFPTE
jgi:hypothetical protein